MVSKRRSRNVLEKNPEIYETHGFLHHEIARRLVEYVKPTTEPSRIINDGAFDHYLTGLLKTRFTGSEVAENIDETTLPADLIVSNLYLQDVWEFEEAMRNYYRLTNPGGRVIMTMIGVGSFGELMQDNGIAINGFPDIEDVGDFMHGLGFKDSVLFIEKINLTYEKLETLLNDLRVVGGRPFDPDKGLRTPNWLETWKENVAKECFDGELYTISFDVIYAEAGVPEVKNMPQKSGDVYVDITHLKADF